MTSPTARSCARALASLMAAPSSPTWGQGCSQRLVWSILPLSALPMFKRRQLAACFLARHPLGDRAGVEATHRYGYRTEGIGLVGCASSIIGRHRSESFGTPYSTSSAPCAHLRPRTLSGHARQIDHSANRCGSIRRRIGFARSPGAFDEQADTRGPAVAGIASYNGMERRPRPSGSEVAPQSFSVSPPLTRTTLPPNLPRPLPPQNAHEEQSAASPPPRLRPYALETPLSRRPANPAALVPIARPTSRRANTISASPNAAHPITRHSGFVAKQNPLSYAHHWAASQE